MNILRDPRLLRDPRIKDCSVNKNTKKFDYNPIGGEDIQKYCMENSILILHPLHDQIELKSRLLPVWDELNQMNAAGPFRIPVDELLKIPDYANIVRNPMDLVKIRMKLENGQYEDAWKFCDDMWLMCENAWLFNKNKRSRIYKLTIQLSTKFVELINPVLQSMGYCCGFDICIKCKRNWHRICTQKYMAGKYTCESCLGI